MFGFLTSVLKLCQLNVLSPLRDERDFCISFARGLLTLTVVVI